MPSPRASMQQGLAERNGLALTVENRPDGRSGVLARVELPLGAPRDGARV